ncbi:MAG: DUF481 domain-containing protein [Marinicaulis sp.]|nr:DUF481 domain-containing protein [Marinicaulis sp.]
MSYKTTFALALSGALAVCPALAADDAAIPDVVQALLDSVHETGDVEDIGAVTRAVVEVFPDYADAINAQSERRIAGLAPLKEIDADAAPAEPSDKAGLLAVSPWDGKIQAGASFASGNSDNLALGLALDAARTAGAFTHNVKAFIDIAESNDVTNQKRWGGEYQLDYAFSDRTYAYTRFSYEEDEFSGFDYRLFGGVGLGHFLYKSESLTWKIEGGPGYRYSPIDLTREIEEQFAFYAASETDWVIREGVAFSQDFYVTWTSPTTTFQSVSALTTSLTEAISTALTLEYRYETDPPDGRVNSDTVARASVVYGF